MATCRGCGLRIEWIKTVAGHLMPVDLHSVRGVLDSGEVVVGRAPHWATCPHAARFRKGQGVLEGVTIPARSLPQGAQATLSEGKDWPAGCGGPS